MSVPVREAPTAIDREEELVSDQRGEELVSEQREEELVSVQEESTIRVSIREVREYSYRALVVAGASPGEAAAAAEQVLHSELYAGAGLARLAVDLASGPWPADGLACIRRPVGVGVRPVIEVDARARAGELRVGLPVIELAAGEPEPVAVVTSADVALSGLLDHALLSAARVASTTVAAVGGTSCGAAELRLATADGRLGQGSVDMAGDPPLLAGLGELVESHRLVVLTGVAVTAFGGLRWSDPGERAELRRTAARRGLEVDRTTWQIVAAQAYRFLVPES